MSEKDKTDFAAKQAATVQTVGVMPRTLIIRPMEYKHPIGVPVMFSGVFGADADSKDGNDIWVATFYDRNEAEMFIMASKTFGQMVAGVRLQVVKNEAGNTGSKSIEVAD